MTRARAPTPSSSVIPTRAALSRAPRSITARPRARIDDTTPRARARASARVGIARARSREPVPARVVTGTKSHASRARAPSRRHALDARENVRRGVRAVVHARVRADDGVVDDEAVCSPNLEARGRVVGGATENSRGSVADGGTGRERDARARRDDFRANSRVDVDVEDAHGERGERDDAAGSETRARREDDDGGADARVESQRRGVG